MSDACVVCNVRKRGCQEEQRRISWLRLLPIVAIHTKEVTAPLFIYQRPESFTVFHEMAVVDIVSLPNLNRTYVLRILRKSSLGMGESTGNQR